MQGCSGSSPKHSTSSDTSVEATVQKPVKLIESVSPSFSERFKQGDAVEIKYKTYGDISLDSVKLFINGVESVAEKIGNGWKYLISESAKVGRITYRILGYKSGKEEVRVGEFAVVPADMPKVLKMKVKKSYPHDNRAYTQGLYWENGYLYESTGEYGNSSLRKVSLQDGKVLKKIDLSKDYFGEGIALLNGKIYQLTWESNKGFVYNADTFEKIGEFGYNGEGWGITTDGKWLYMTGGTHKIFRIDPETFKTVETIEVYSDKGKIDYLNELEWINGEIWANIYTSDLIVKINPVTGAVTGVIDLSSLHGMIDKDAKTDCLNGIAYDADGKRIFVTGKNWNKLFEIEIF